MFMYCSGELLQSLECLFWKTSNHLWDKYCMFSAYFNLSAILTFLSVGHWQSSESRQMGWSCSQEQLRWCCEEGEIWFSICGTLSQGTLYNGRHNSFFPDFDRKTWIHWVTQVDGWTSVYLHSICGLCPVCSSLGLPTPLPWIQKRPYSMCRLISFLPIQ